MYTITPPNDPNGRNLSLEHGLNRIENDFCVVRRDFIQAKRPLGAQQRAIALAFLAASYFRTPSQREETRAQWKPMLDMGLEMEELARTATPDQLAEMARYSRSLPKRGRGISLDEVQAIVDKPFQTTLAAQIHTTVPLLFKLTHMTIFCTNKVPGFITSDDPVVWIDPEAHKRPPLYRAPAFMYKTIEITMPISPTRLMFLSRQKSGLPEYCNIDTFDLEDTLLNDLNRRTCLFAREKVVVSRNEFRPIWAHQGEPPLDEWPSFGQGSEETID